MNIHYAILFVSDMAAAVVFYRDVLELTLRFETPDWTEFATDGRTLALHSTKVPANPRASDAGPAGSVRIGFNVADLDLFHARMGEHDVVCLQAPTESFGAKLALYVGPDDHVFSVAESR